MKHNWEYRKIEEVCEFVNGFAFKSNLFTSTGSPILRISNIQNDVINDSDMVYFNPSDYTEDFERFKVNSGDIVIAMSGATTGKIGIHTGTKTYYLNQRVGKFKIKNTNVINGRFLFYSLKKISNQFLIDALGVAQPNISSTQIKKYSIPTPKIHIQKQIVSELDKLSLVIEKKKQQVKELDNLAQAIFYDMFGDPVENDKGWETKQLGDCFTYIKNGVNIKQDKTQSGLPITRIETLSNGVFNRDRMGYAGITDIVKYQQYILNDKDLLMSHINSKAYIGRTVMYAKKGDETIIHGMNLLRLVPVEDLESVFFCYMTKSDYFKKKIANIRKDAVNQSSFAISDLKKIAVPIPPLPLQQSFAQKVESIERQKELINQSIREAQTLFDSRMEYYFGE